MPQQPPRKLFLKFTGRVLEHLGIQMYQKPVDAVSELVANAWDADATEVKITLPRNYTRGSKIVVADNGLGMSFKQCEKEFLEVGRNRRGDDPDAKTTRGRPVLGRKGIGKFAGFGIAEVITLDTISAKTGERVVFKLVLTQLMKPASISDKHPVEIVTYEGPDRARRAKHGTTITLSILTLNEPARVGVFARSMARRFLLLEGQDQFKLTVGGKPLPDGLDLAGVQFSFPRDYEPSEAPAGLTVDSDGWGTEVISGGHKIRWRILFHKDTIAEEELRGVAVFAKGKLAQRPFTFNITKGFEGQQSIEYLSGQVDASYVDALPVDLIATERQRLNWSRPETRPLQEWGQARLRQVATLWVERRGRKRAQELVNKVAKFSDRLDSLERAERRTLERALGQLGKIPTLTDEQYNNLGQAVLTSWEQGRLKGLINDIAEAKEFTQHELLNVLIEAKVLTALSTAEAVTTKLQVVKSLRDRIKKQQLENNVRDFIADNPWLISPKWETYRVERSVRQFLIDVGKVTGWTTGLDGKRIDLALSSGEHLLVVEFMRPGKKIDRDHLDRFERYVDAVRAEVEANSAGRFRLVTGYLIADQLTSSVDTQTKLRKLRKDSMYAMDWKTLLEEGVNTWREFLDILAMRSPKDVRLKGLLEILDDVDMPTKKP